MSQADSSSSSSTSVQDDDWNAVSDPKERRRIQSRIAQRKFREKVRWQKEETERARENEQKAGGAYCAPEAEDLDSGELSGLPWGGVSLRHVLVTGKAKEQSSRETSLYADSSKAGGSSRLGLHLLDRYARGSPAWTAWRGGTVPFAQYRPP